MNSGFTDKNFLEIVAYVFTFSTGDLPYTIGRVHAQAYIPMNHVSPMVFASLFSILGESF